MISPSLHIEDILSKVVHALELPEDSFNEYTTALDMRELLRLHYGKIYQAYEDFALAHESLKFISSDYQLRLKAEDIWKQQLEIFREKIYPLGDALTQECKVYNIDIQEDIKALLD